ncbi:hypothetical protein FACS189472_09330 [Alphaproteobacteria bacterium]|nr:hypothetical protein FACS189472_09330 [Alphaproteobacteria bacterium]
MTLDHKINACAASTESNDYVAKNPRRNDRKAGAFRIDIATGRFNDFATGDRGGGIIDLAAFVYNCNIVVAADNQKLLEQYLGDTELLILDNISTLTSVKENEADSWLNIQKWLIRLRQKNISVLLIHHAGKNGGQRGSCRKEDILDTVIALKRPSDYENHEGSKFDVKFEKCRGFSGDQAKSFEARLCGNIETSFVWTMTDCEAVTKSKIKELMELGMNQREIAKELGISQPSVCRLEKGMDKP